MRAPLSNNASAHDTGTLAQAPHRVGRVALIVRDLDRATNFYLSTIGLDLIASEAGTVGLGAGGSVLLELRHDPDARPASRQEAGLFHTAFLLPSRAHMGLWLAAMAHHDVKLTGAADHLVSEAVYLNDPEGNGVEVYVDRPASSWVRSSGMIEMASNPLDLDDLVAAAGSRKWDGFPDEGSIGHVHLQVGDVAEAEAFYSDVLGLDVTCRYRGASFFGSGGYHHQLATNVWNSRGATMRREASAGVAEIEFIVSQAVLGAVRVRSGASSQDVGLSSLTLRDPWGLDVRLRSS